jgi:glycine dehydrogenase subunit 1
MNYIPVNEQDTAAMLDAIGIQHIDELFDVIPAAARIPALALPAGISEQKLTQTFEALSKKNASLKDYACFRGAGVYDHFIPALVEEITGRSEFYTAYTPYQAEASQGTLQVIFEYQSMIAALTGMDVANASLYDGASAVAEAALLAVRVTGRKKIVITDGLHPEYRAVLATYLQGAGVQIVMHQMTNGKTIPAAMLIDDATACCIVQSPNFFGTIEDLQSCAAAAHATGALFVAVVNPVSLGLLRPPGACGADIAVGEGQSLGNRTGLGGASFGFFAVKKELSWKIPGRIVGQTVDRDGRRGYVLTLQSREQHIRREKATSNICTNAALNALAASVYLAGWGPDGLRQVGELNVAKSRYACDQLLAAGGFDPAFDHQVFFNEFVLRTSRDIPQLQKKLLKKKIIGPLELGRWFPAYTDCLLFCVTEARTREQIDALVQAVKE